MLNRKFLFLLGLTLATPTLALAKDADTKKDAGPCKQIMEACSKAGFVKGAHQEGKGLFAHCMGPLVSGKAPKTTAKIPVPTIDPATIAACKAKHEERKEHKAAKGK